MSKEIYDKIDSMENPVAQILTDMAEKREKKPSASREVKRYGFRSVKEVAYILGYDRATIHRTYNRDEKLFFDYLKVAFQIKYLEEKDEK